MTAEKEWLTTDEAAERLANAGLPLTRRSLYEWKKRGLLTWRRHGPHWRVSAASVDDFIQNEGE